MRTSRARLRDPDLHVGREYQRVAYATQPSRSSPAEAVAVHREELAALESVTHRLAHGIVRRARECPVGVEMAPAAAYQDARLRHQAPAIETESL